MTATNSGKEPAETAWHWKLDTVLLAVKIPFLPRREAREEASRACLSAGSGL